MDRDNPDTALTPRRQPQQDRGQRRVDQLLDAAAEVIAEIGVEAATTNAIAARAGASVGSLYHFFPNKDAVVDALADRYMRELASESAAAVPLDDARQPVDIMIDQILDPLIAFHIRHPAYARVMEARMAPDRRSHLDEHHQYITGRIGALLAARWPQMPAALRDLRAHTGFQIVHALLPNAASAPQPRRDALMRELKTVLIGYMTVVDGATAAATRDDAP